MKKCFKFLFVVVFMLSGLYLFPDGRRVLAKSTKVGDTYYIDVAAATIWTLLI